MNLDNSQLTAKKSLSQNFLINQQIIDKIAKKMGDFVALSDCKNIIEIGPGEGSLTELFLDWGKPVVALEIDNRAVEFLEKKFDKKANLVLIGADATDYFSVKNIDKLNLLKPFALLSNLPFNIGSRLLVDLALTCSEVNFSVILQSEVAQKLTVKENHLTFFGCWINSFWKIKEIMTIAPCHFRPAPKVYATLVEAISRKTEGSWLFGLNETELLESRRVLKSIFSQPRKSLSSHLRLLGLNNMQAQEFYEQTKFLPNTRLNWENYETVWKEICIFIKNHLD